jgi:outer membrane receptor protein involved in Fe transport
MQYTGATRAKTRSFPTPRAAFRQCGRPLQPREYRYKRPLGSALTGNHTYSRFNPAGGLTYKILPELTVYASFADTYRAGPDTGGADLLQCR